jgi:hypothetical protein
MIVKTQPRKKQEKAYLQLDSALSNWEIPLWRIEYCDGPGAWVAGALSGAKGSATMKPRCYSAAVAAGIFALCRMSLSANAASVSIDTDVTTLPGGFIPFDPTPTATAGTYDHDVTGSIANVRISPYAGTIYGPTTSPPSGGSPYESISTGGVNLFSKPGAALFDVPTGTTEITILWGSPDPYNSMLFLTKTDCTTVSSCTPSLTNHLVATYFGSDVPGHSVVPPGTPDSGFNYVTFDVSGIGAIMLADTGKAAFEFANVEFFNGAGGLGLLGLLARKRRKAAIAA